MQCRFKTSDGYRCSRSAYPAFIYCSLHLGCDRKLTEDVEPNPQFVDEFQAVLDAQDGNWRGFVFPDGIKLPEEIPFKVDARGSRLGLFEQSRVVFKEPVDFSDSVFKRDLALTGSVFEKSVSFANCKFDGPVTFNHIQCKSTASFYRSEFAGRTVFRVNFKANANFNESVFREGVFFSGWRNVYAHASGLLEASDTLSATGSIGGVKPPILKLAYTRMMNMAKLSWRFAKRSLKKSVENFRNRSRAIQRQYAKIDPSAEAFRMFEAEGHLESIIFSKPDQTLFNEVDLSRAYFRGTNLKGVRFLGVNWWQPKLKRNGLYDEIFIRFSKDGPFRHSTMPVLEETCRNARVALEENRNFNAASDFYLAEMEAARLQFNLLRRYLFSVNALYQCVSNYGTSVGRALRILLWLYVFHLASSIYLELPSGQLPELSKVLEASQRSLKILILAAPALPGVQSSVQQTWIDLILRVLGPVQIAMIALAFRSRIKRH